MADPHSESMTSPNDSPAVVPFVIDIPQQEIDELRRRIAATRFPDQVTGVGWQQGTDLAYLRGFLAYWAGEFDWPHQQRQLNNYHHFRVKLDGSWVHFVHIRAADGAGIPLIATHGWPSTFTELLPLAQRLADPRAYGIEGPAFDVVVPSLPGYGFSERPDRTGVTTRSTARRWHELMGALGYRRYGAHGGDFGCAVATFLALDQPASVLGIHLSNLDVSPYLGPGSSPLTEAEESYVRQQRRWADAERGYSAIQSTKPQTLGYALNDSPAGLAAWILEKWRSWTDCGGDLESRLSRQFLATMLTIYWSTQSITTSMRDYYDNRWHAPAITVHDHVDVPCGFAVCPNEFVAEGEPPRQWAQRLYNVRRWTVLPRGGHFAAIEEPDLLAREIAAFFAATAAT
jgi:pimeloyl-ACP methyl ester carboxylesterase